MRLMRVKSLWFVRSLIAVILCGGLWALIHPSGAGAQAPLVGPLSVRVNSLGDQPDVNAGDGVCDMDAATPGDQCTLRAAIQETNAFVGAGHDRITFDPALHSGTISLDTALPDIATDLVIAGPGANLLRVRRSAAPGTPNFRILKAGAGGSSTVAVTISDLTISNGVVAGAVNPANWGGGIFNSAALTIDSCVITDNQATSGGGIVNLGSLTIVRTTIANNTATEVGGGILNVSDESQGLTVTDSTISNNVSGNQGGGIHNGTSLAFITNTTISSNTAFQGAGISNLHQLHLLSVTLTANTASSNSGGIRNAGSVVLANTILAGNTAPVGQDGAGQDFLSLDYNLLGNTSNMQISGEIAHNLTSLDPRLGPLADNGGLTRTHELLHGSPAIDAGRSTLTSDQRGFARAVDHPGVPNTTAGDAADIGAYEAAAFEVNSTADTDDGACTLNGTGNGCTLREAIIAANTTAGAQVITFKHSLTASGPATITLFSALPDLASEITIDGPGANLLTIRRSNLPAVTSFRIFTSVRVVTITDLTIAGGFTINDGGGVRNSSSLTMINVNVYGNTASRGGGVYNQGALFLTNCNIGGTATGQANHADVTGGGLFNISGPLVMNGGSIAGNTGNGFASATTATLIGVTIKNNTQSGNSGAGVDLLGGVNTFIRSLIANNVSTGGDGGGGIRVATQAFLVNCTVSGNTTQGKGGGIYNFNGFARLTNSTVTGNRADSDNNSAGVENGGGIYGAVATNVRMNNSIIAGNFIGPGSAVASDVSVGISPASTFNVIGVCENCGLTDGIDSNQVGVTNAGLALLADNGGPTLTHALLPSSPALDKGSNAFVTVSIFGNAPFTDQRGAGFSRIVDGPDADATATVDIGAFEQQVPLSQIVDATTNEDTPLVVPFQVGDRSAITSITATASNQSLIPNHPDHLRLVDAGSTELIVINPAANLAGTTQITATVNTTGGSTSRTFTVTVTPVNDPPSFSLRQPFVSLEDAGLVEVQGLAFDLSPGPPDESGQTLSFQVVNNTNPALFSVAPAISPDGTLTYVAAPDASGSANITIVLKDNGGTANGGRDTSQPRTFGVIVTAVDDPPVTPVLLLEEGSSRALALDSVFQTRDPFSLLDVFNLSNDRRRRVSLFVWRLGLQPGDTASNLTVIAQDDQGTTYPLTVEFVGMLPGVNDVIQVNVLLPENVTGAPRDLRVSVQLRGPASNQGIIRIAAP